MSASLGMRGGFVAAGLCCWLLGTVVAAEINPAGAQIDSPQQPADATNRTGQIDRAQTSQPAQRGLLGQPYTANFRGTQGTAQPGQEVAAYLATCMLNNNKAQVELCQFAAQQAQSPEVKKFAQQLAKDHQQCVEKLQQIAGRQTDGLPNRSASLDANAAPGSDLNRSATGTATAGRPAMTRGNAALQQLAGIEQKINEQCQQALREELQQKSGAEFDACFLGAQIAGHMHMLAALEVIPQEVQGPLKQVAEEARPTIRKHLDEAKQLMKQAQAGTQGSAQAQRTSTTTETQR